VPDKNNYLTHLHSPPVIDIENAQIKKHETEIIRSLSHFHGFINQDSLSCYANSILQCLFNVQCINSAIKLSPYSELKKLCLDFLNPLSNDALDCYQLRLQFHSKEFDINRQQDSTEFLLLLIKKYDYLKCLMSFDTENYYKCQNCDYEIQEIYKTEIGTLRIPIAKNKFQIQELVDYNFYSWNSDLCKEVKCPHCNNLNVLTTRTEIKNTQNILIFSLQLTNSNIQKNTNLLLSGVPQSKITFCDKNYTLSGAIFHHGETVSKGHYTAVVRKNKHWFKADDNTISKCSWPRNSKDIYILFFEKT
jgi:ubiquitin C-terminal hydrolase